MDPSKRVAALSAWIAHARVRDLLMTPPTLRAIIFDFNGVIADDETSHFRAFQQALREDGLFLTAEEYYGRHMGMDERGCVTAIFRSAGRPDPIREQRIHERKATLFRAYTDLHPPTLFPGITDLIARAKRRYHLAIASGGRREQILRALRGTDIGHAFDVMVTADDMTIGKPDPAIYRYTLERLNATRSIDEPIFYPRECLVFEDSLAGIRSGFAAGMSVVGVATTYPAHYLKEAHLVLPTLESMTLECLENVIQQCQREA